MPSESQSLRIPLLVLPSFKSLTIIFDSIGDQLYRYFLAATAPASVRNLGIFNYFFYSFPFLKKVAYIRPQPETEPGCLVVAERRELVGVGGRRGAVFHARGAAYDGESHHGKLEIGERDVDLAHDRILLGVGELDVNVGRTVAPELGKKLWWHNKGLIEAGNTGRCNQ